MTVSIDTERGRTLKGRTQKIRDSIMDSMLRPKVEWRCAKSVWDVYPEAAREPLIVRNALAVKIKLETAPITIWPDQLIAGSYVLPQSDVIIGGALPDYATAAEKKAAAALGYSVSSIVGHIVPSYPKLLRMGTLGIRDEAVSRYDKVSCDAADARAFYKACEIVTDALADFAARHAALCRELAEAMIADGGDSDHLTGCAADCGDYDRFSNYAGDCADRAAELLAMADDLDYAPARPARTFRQAVAAIWLTHLAFQLTGNSLSIGRFDQHVGPYFEADQKNGEITYEQAEELVTCFLLKFNERSIDNNVRKAACDAEAAQARNDAAWAERDPFAHDTQRRNFRDDIDASNHWIQNIIVGGVRPEDGADAGNAVTYMCLGAFEANRMTNPNLTLRVHSGSPEPLLRRACEVLREGGGNPAFFSDEAIVPALVKWGIPLEDARDYTNDGCWEIIIAGRNDFYFDRFNMLRCLEWALNNGRSRMDGKAEAPDPGDPKLFKSYEAVYDAFLGELYYEVEGLMAKNEANFGKRAAIAPVPLLSALLEGPMELGGDMTQVGAKHITYGLIAEGVSHVIDSLCAIRKVVFEDGAATMPELIRALGANFEGYEALRAMLRAAPKYGANDKTADETGARLIETFAQKVAELNPKYPKITYLPGAGTFSWYIAIGEGCAASPDGRLSGEEVGSNLSPSAGAAVHGVTGAMISHASIGMSNLPVGSPTDLRVSARQVSGEAGLERLMGLVKTYVSLGGNMLTLTVADTETLRRAQASPEQYRDLRVRMGGWSAYFTMLSKQQQEHHIAKQEAL